MAQEPYYVTAEALERLRQKLGELKTVKRRQILERLKEAKDQGDITDSAEYDAAKQAHEQNESKIADMENMLKRAVIIKARDHYVTVMIGSRVEVRQGLKKIAFTIVGPEESQPSQGFISNESPFGKQLLGKKVGDEFEMKNARNATSKYKILKISQGVKWSFFGIIQPSPRQAGLAHRSGLRHRIGGTTAEKTGRGISSIQAS